MTYSEDLDAYLAYLNAPRDFLDKDEQALFNEDLIKARAAMERSYLEGHAPPPPDFKCAILESGRGRPKCRVQCETCRGLWS